MASHGTPARKMRRILDDEEDSDDDELPDITDPAFLKPLRAPTPQFAKEKAEQDSDAEGLFSDDEDVSEEEEKSSARKKRYHYI